MKSMKRTYKQIYADITKVVEKINQAKDNPKTNQKKYQRDIIKTLDVFDKVFELKGHYDYKRMPTPLKLKLMNDCFDELKDIIKEYDQKDEEARRINEKINS